jgi:hypothetical protein
MSQHRWIWLLCAAFLIALVAALAECRTQANTGKKDDEEIGPRGGPVAEWVDYHAEFTVDHATKTAKIYILDEKLKDIKMDPTKITKAKLTITSVKPEVAIELKYDAKLSGAKMTVFVGTDDVLGKKADLEGTIAATIGKKPYKSDFKYEVNKKKKAK